MAKISDIDITSLLFQEGSAPSTPASTKWRLYAKTDGIYYKDDAGTETGPLTAGGGTFYTAPVVTNKAANFAGSGTTVAVTVTAPATTDKLVAFCGATRTCDSITQTNVTWTRRFQGNGNGNFLTVFTGVAASSAGTTATFNYTGSGSQEAVVFTVNSASSAFTSCTSVNTNTGASGTVQAVAADVTLGTHYLGAGVSSGVSSTYQIANQQNRVMSNGGVIHGVLLRANVNGMDYTAIASGSNAYYVAIVALT